MAEMTIQLRCDPSTGKKNIIILLRSDPDVLPQEHEEAHRALVEKLIQGGVVAASEMGQIIVERMPVAPAAAAESAAAAPVAEGPRLAARQAPSS
ncbi:MAG: hypothetical protein NZ700_09915 [Gemmataceae bacterium]|nr:hypothetical protein [Gemmataceae bacterium]MDW8264884.1 hypothetical protein [Gemmataceae bacterium]